MIAIVLDTSSTHLLVSILRDSEILSLCKVKNCVEHSVHLLKTIHSSLQNSKIEIADVDTIFIVTGPGSFTGLRIGVTVAKMIGYTKNVNIIPISSLEIMATTPFEGDYIAPYIDARRGYIYGGIYDKNLEPIMKDAYISIEEFLHSFPQNKKTILVSNTPLLNLPTSVQVKEDVQKIVEKKKNNKPVNPHLVNPNYLKKTEAEEKKNYG